MCRVKVLKLKMPLSENLFQNFPTFFFVLFFSIQGSESLQVIPEVKQLCQFNGIPNTITFNTKMYNKILDEHSHRKQFRKSFIYILFLTETI